MPANIALMQFECGTRILRVIHGRDARATSPNCISTCLLRLIHHWDTGKNKPRTLQATLDALTGSGNNASGQTDRGLATVLAFL